MYIPLVQGCHQPTDLRGAYRAVLIEVWLKSQLRSALDLPLRLLPSKLVALHCLLFLPKVPHSKTLKEVLALPICE